MEPCPSPAISRWHLRAGGGEVATDGGERGGRLSTMGIMEDKKGLAGLPMECGMAVSAPHLIATGDAVNVGAAMWTWARALLNLGA